MKKLSILCAALLGLGACSEAEVQVYDSPDTGINFWVESQSGALSVYPDALETQRFESYDPGSLELGMLAFAPVAVPPVMEVGVEVMGFAPAEDRRVTLRVDEELSAEGLDAIFPESYKLAANEATAVFPIVVDMSGMEPGQTGELVVVFDYGETDFVPGVVQRDHVLATCTRRSGTPIPNDAVALLADLGIFGPGMESMIWDMFGYGSYYGAYSVTKLRFCAVALNTLNLSVALPVMGSQTALVARLKASLEEYKAMSEADPVMYPPLYQTGETWISFP